MQHNAPRGPTTASAMEVEAHVPHFAPRGQEQPPPGVRPAPLSEVAGPQAAVTVGYVAAVAPSLAVVPVSDLLHDDATVQFLLQQSLLARAQEEEEARELEEVKRMEKAVVTKMQRLEAEVQMYAGQDLSQLSDLERAAVTFVARSDALRRRRRERRRKRKKQRKKKLPRAPRPRCRRPCVHQRQVPAVRSSVVTQRQVPTVLSFMLPVQFLDTVFDMPFVVLRQVPGLMVQKTVVRPQLQSIYGRRHSLSFSRGRSPWSRLFSRPQRFLSCRSFSGGRCPCCAGRAVPQVVHLRVQRNAWFDRGYKILRQFTEIFTFFYVKRWMTDPEVDSRLHFALEMWTLFYCPLYLVVTCSLCGGESFSPDDAFVSALDSVMPMKGKHTINYLQYQCVRCVAMSCGGDSFSPWCLRFCMGQRKAVKGKYTINYILYPC